MPTPKDPCPFCHAAESAPKWTTQDQEDTGWQVRECPRCHTLFLHPQPDDACLARAYAPSYYGGQSEQKFGPWMERLRDAFALRRARRLTRGLSPGAAILDVGCGDGRFLAACAKTASVSLHGIELPGPAADRASRISGATIFQGSLGEVPLPDAAFDLVTLTHVYEHLRAPGDAIRTLARIVRPGGTLYLAYPNGTSWQARWFGGQWFHLDPPRHLSLVAPHSLVRALADLGFEKVGESHLSWEQNIYGWLQSVLNCFPGKRNWLYECLKRNRAYISDTGVTLRTLHFVVAALLLIPAIAIDLLAAVARRGATIELQFRKLAPVCGANEAAPLPH